MDFFYDLYHAYELQGDHDNASKFETSAIKTIHSLGFEPDFNYRDVRYLRSKEEREQDIVYRLNRSTNFHSVWKMNL
jgi:hypothetical protein